MSFERSQDKVRPTVMIVGGGLSGLLLGILLSQINIPYHIFERAKEMHCLGGVMTMSANILPVFEQLGLLEDIMKFSKIYKATDVYNGDMTKLATQDRMFLKEALGYYTITFARCRLFELLRKQIPPKNISLNKKVLRSEERDGRAIIHCSDNTFYEGDILIGADGAYSGVRRRLYKRLDGLELLPHIDLEDSSIGYTFMVGVAEPKNPEKYPELKGPTARFPVVVDGGNKIICWTLSLQLPEKEVKSHQFRNSQFGPESIESMTNEFEDDLCPQGGKMGDLIADTPKDHISKVFLEEKIFKTWYHGRTVLIGDAVHKLQPAGRLGACNAFQDAVALANHLYRMKDSSQESITSAFSGYYAERYHRALDHFKRSHAASQVILGQVGGEDIAPNLVQIHPKMYLQESNSEKSRVPSYNFLASTSGQREWS
ncbi:hypothetical protein BGX21_004060 [Mortierella sp. AD011]|nr:hypothetical protein BGX21_004060 [Mortierella sp. AD011]